MKISRISIKNFKCFKTFDVEVKNSITGDIADRFLFLGDNGVGKTTVLQAVALCFSMISGRIRQVSDFQWQGWVPGRYETWGTPEVELDVDFSDEEITATREVARKWLEWRKPEVATLPGENKRLTLRLSGERFEVLDENGGASKENLYQLRGRPYATNLIKTSPWVRDYFRKLPGLFWFDQLRNLASPPEYGDSDDKRQDVAYSVGVSRLRRFLNNWKLAQLSGAAGGKDWLNDLERSYKKVFPDRYFSGIEPIHSDGLPTSEDYYFLISDGQRTYDIEEMSAGEQSVFPMLFEFVRMQIHNCIVIIDEVDLNLHPPLAQSFLNALPAFGQNCQFLLTTHSQAISSLFGPGEICRLPGGKLCL